MNVLLIAAAAAALPVTAPAAQAAEQDCAAGHACLFRHAYYGDKFRDDTVVGTYYLSQQEINNASGASSVINNTDKVLLVYVPNFVIRFDPGQRNAALGPGSNDKVYKYQLTY